MRLWKPCPLHNIGANCATAITTCFCLAGPRAPSIAEHPIRFLAHTPTDQLGTWNFGGYSNARVDELLPRIQQELERTLGRRCWMKWRRPCRRRSPIVPLYTEPLLLAARDGVEVTLRPDNFFMLRWVRVDSQ